MDNKTVLVTGSTQGLGRHLALALAAKGATLLLHGRDQGRLDQVAADVRAVSPGVPVRTYLANLADLGQVRAMAARVLGAEDRLDVLVNNAAIGFGTDHTRREVSPQGHELRFAVNYLAPCLLARELLPLLTASAPARVVNVASVGQAPIDFGDVMLEHGYGGENAYCRSKLAMIMSTFDLATEIPADQVTVNAVHPAHLMDTRGVRESGLTPEIDIEEGVRPTVRLITDPALATVTGTYFHQFTESPAHEQAYDTTARTRLATLTRDLLS